MSIQVWKYRLAMLLCLVLFWSAVILNAKANELESCVVNNGEGRCMPTRTCPSAVEKLKKSIQPNYPRCKWSGNEDIICCPDASVPSNLKSTAACQNYSLAADWGVQPQILAGIEAGVGEFPHVAALGYSNNESNRTQIDWGQCGGCLISYDYVLTAAHCLLRADNKEPVMVRLGKTDLAGNSDDAVPYDFKVTDKIVHPNYNVRTKVNDIALLRLEKPITLSRNVMPACLYNKSEDPENFITTGWEYTSDRSSGRNSLLKAVVKSVDLESCNKSYNVPPLPTRIYETQLCGTEPEDGCHITGPAQIRTDRNNNIYAVIGMLSYGRSCGSNAPLVYTRISSYIAWIEGIVWP